MAAQIVYDNVDDGADLRGQLFAGKKFWVAQRMPARKDLLEKIKSNGGEITTLEKKADFLVADHFRKDCPAGSISYTFIQKSIDNGVMDDPGDHLAGPATGTARPAGVGSRPGKNTRAAYTSEEDRILYKWVRDHERNGGAASGNELYKQLEQQYPRHTWQSWRERYLKKLRDQPPVGLNVPENAPPSPPSDQSAEHISPKRLLANAQKKTAKEVEPNNGVELDIATNVEATFTEATKSENSRKSENYTTDDLEVTFQMEDWEELYANADTIAEYCADAETYAETWAGWAASDEGNRTAEQWRQYFEKVVLPEYEQDPQTKRALIRRKVLDMHDRDRAAMKKRSPNQAENPATPRRVRRTEEQAQRRSPVMEPRIVKAMDARRGSKKHMDAYEFWVQATTDAGAVDQSDLNRSKVDLHKVLRPRWRKLSTEVQAPYHALEAADRLRIEREARQRHNELAMPPSPAALSSSTMVQHTPEYITKAFIKEVKRSRSDSGPAVASDSMPRRSKRRRQEGPLSEESNPLDGEGLHGDDIVRSPLDNEEQRTEEVLSEHHVMDNIIQTQLQAQHSDQDDLDADRPSPTIELEDVDSVYTRLRSPLPSDTMSPSPRSRRDKVTAFETQAILSSPSQGLALAPLPRPSKFLEEISSSPSPGLAPLPRPNRDLTPSVEGNTTTRSPTPAESVSSPVRQFEYDKEIAPGPLPLPNPRQESPALSDASSDGSADPDPPLTPDELNEFFKEQIEQGFTDPEITAALKHTRCRPELAVEVLDAWKEHKPVPSARGIWSGSDDEDVESGHLDSLARLEKKHTFDGWGGITERMRFLEQLRKKRQGN